MASMQELLKYLEQFMHGSLSQHATPTMPHPTAGGMPAGAGGAMPSGGGMPPGAMPPGGMPPGAAAGGMPGAAPPGEAGPGAMPGLPPELANATPQELQAAMQQFGQLHPELAPYLSSDGPVDLQSVLGQLSSIPPQALEGFTSSSPDAAGGAEEFGAPLSAEFNDFPDFGAGTTPDLSSFEGFGSGNGAISDLPSVLMDPTAGEFGPLPTSVGVGMSDDYDALAGALTGESGVDYTDLTNGSPVFEPAFETQPNFETFEPQPDSYVSASDPFDEPMQAFGEPQPDEPQHEDFSNAVGDYQDQ